MACVKPVITVPTFTSDASGQSGTVTWTTDVAADSWVFIGVNGAATPVPANGPQDTANGVTSHSVAISGLFPGQQFDWGIRSRAIDAGSACDYHYYTFFGGDDSGNHSTPSAAPAGSWDYYIVPIGGTRVTQGYNLHVQLQGGALVGTYTNGSMKIVVTGFPPNSIGRWPATQDLLIGNDTVSTTTVTNDTITKHFYSVGSQQEFALVTNSGGITPPGSYTLTFTVSGAGQPTHTATWPITVDSVNSPFGIAFPYGIPSSYPAIPNLTDWVNNMSTNGAFNCAEDEDVTPRTIRANNSANLCTVSVVVNRCAWFYDGVRVYYNISNYLGDHTTWQVCRDNVHQIYRDEYLARNGKSSQLILMFPEGLYMDYLRTGNPANLTAIDNIQLGSADIQNGVMVPVRLLQREAAYGFKAAYFESKLGRSQNVLNTNTAFLLTYHLDMVLGHLDQIGSGVGTYWENFMVGLAADALLTYYEDGNHDPRIPSAIKYVADYLWANQWSVITGDGGTFAYSNFRSQTNNGQANSAASSGIALNLLIAPMYAWLYKMTGIQSYQTNGDLIWQYGATYVGADGQGGGVSQMGSNNGPTAGNSGKQFSQNYYWAHKYVKWRSAPVATTFGSGVNLTSSSGVTFQ